MPPFEEAPPALVPGEGRLLEVVHAGPFEGAVGHVEAGRLDYVDSDAQAGGHAQYGSGVPGYIGLEERNSEIVFHGHSLNRRFVKRKSATATVANLQHCAL